MTGNVLKLQRQEHITGEFCAGGILTCRAVPVVGAVIEVSSLILGTSGLQVFALVVSGIIAILEGDDALAHEGCVLLEIGVESHVVGAIVVGNAVFYNDVGAGVGVDALAEVPESVAVDQLVLAADAGAAHLKAVAVALAFHAGHEAVGIGHAVADGHSANGTGFHLGIHIPAVVSIVVGDTAIKHVALAYGQLSSEAVGIFKAGIIVAIGSTVQYQVIGRPGGDIQIIGTAQTTDLHTGVAVVVGMDVVHHIVVAGHLEALGVIHGSGDIKSVEEPVVTGMDNATAQALEVQHGTGFRGGIRHHPDGIFSRTVDAALDVHRALQQIGAFQQHDGLTGADYIHSGVNIQRLLQAAVAGGVAIGRDIQILAGCESGGVEHFLAGTDCAGAGEDLAFTQILIGIGRHHNGHLGKVVGSNIQCLMDPLTCLDGDILHVGVDIVDTDIGGAIHIAHEDQVIFGALGGVCGDDVNGGRDLLHGLLLSRCILLAGDGCKFQHLVGGAGIAGSKEANINKLAV